MLLGGTGAVGVDAQLLVRWMDLQAADSEVDEPIDGACRIADDRGVARVEAAEGQQPTRIGPGYVGDPPVDLVGESHQPWRDVVDHADPVDAGGIHLGQHRLRIVHHRRQALEVRSAARHHVQGAPVQLVPRLDVDVDIGNGVGKIFQASLLASIRLISLSPRPALAGRITRRPLSVAGAHALLG